MDKKKLSKKQQALKDQYYAAMEDELHKMAKMLDAKALLEDRQKELEDAQHTLHMVGYRLEEAGVYL